MMPQPPQGQGPIDPRGAFVPPPPPDPRRPTGAPNMPPTTGAPGFAPAGYAPQGFGPPGFGPPGYGPPGYAPGAGFGPPPSPPPGKGGLARAMLTTLVTSLFGISLLLNVYLLMFTGFIGQHNATALTTQSGDSSQVVAVIPIVNMMINQSRAEALDKMLKQAEDDSNVKAVVLRIDTPGGEVTASDEMYHRILTFKARRPTVPVVISMGGLATSGGYYAACAGDFLIAEPTTLTANIGVLSQSVNLSRLADKWGVDDTTMHSTGADFKTAGDFLKPVTPEDRAYMQGLIDSMARQFQDVVKRGRQGRLKAPLEDVFNAQAYTADRALAMGIVDKVGYLDDAIQTAAQKAQLTNITVQKYEEPITLMSLFMMSSRSTVPPAEADAGAIKINGVPVEIPALEQLANPRPMYLFTGR